MKRYTAQIQIESDVPARMRAGTVLRADVYRPGGSGPWPVLLGRLPYGKHTPVAGVAGQGHGGGDDHAVHREWEQG